MGKDEIQRKIKSERLRLAASMCQTLAIGMILLAVLTPVLGADGDANRLSWPKTLLSTVAASALLVYAHILIGLAVWKDPWTA